MFASITKLLRRKNVFSFLFLAGLVLVFMLAKTKVLFKKDLPVNPEIEKTLVPEIPQNSPWFYPIESTLTAADFSNFPQQLPLLVSALPTPLTEEQIVSKASSMGLTNKPLITHDSQKGPVHIYTQGRRQVAFYPQENRISYTVNTEDYRESILLPLDRLIERAKAFLFANSLVENSGIYFSFASYHKKDPHDPEGIRSSTPEEANLIIINFSPLDSEIKLITDPRSSPVSVWMLPNGEVSKAEVSTLSLSFSPEKYKLNSFAEFTQSLHNAALINLDDGNLLPQDLQQDSIRKITVNQIELGYLHLSTLEPLSQPVFILSGPAVLKNKVEVNAVLYLPAAQI